MDLEAVGMHSVVSGGLSCDDVRLTCHLEMEVDHVAIVYEEE